MENREKILSGDLIKTVWHLAWPNITTALLTTVNMLTDRFFVGRLGEGSIAIVTSVWFYMWLFYGSSQALSTGNIALVARFVGQGKIRKAEQSARQSLILGVVVAGLFTAISVIWTEPIFKLLGIAQNLYPQAKLYFYPLVFSSFLSYGIFSLLSNLRGLGDMLVPLRILVIVNLLCIVLDYLLIFGHWGLPRLGILGAGVAMVAARTCGVILLYWAHKLHKDFNLFSGSFAPKYLWIYRILRLGSPLVAQNLIRSLGGLFLLGILARTQDGTAAVAAIGVGMVIEGFAYMPAVGYAMAATTMVGQNLGAESTERAEKSGWIAAYQGAMIMGIVAVLFAIFAAPIARVFSSHPATIHLICTYFWINAVSEPFLGLAIVLSGALEGAGDTRIPTLISICTIWCLRVPLAFLFCSALKLHPNFVWLAMSLSTIAQGIWITARFRGGKWKTARV